MFSNNRIATRKYFKSLSGLRFLTHRNFATHTTDATKDATNKVNGKPIYYIKDATDTVYSNDTQMQEPSI